MVNFHSFFEYILSEPDQVPTADGVVREDNPQTLQQTKEKRNSNDVINTECIGHTNNSDSLFESNVVVTVAAAAPILLFDKNKILTKDTAKAIAP